MLSAEVSDCPSTTSVEFVATGYSSAFEDRLA